MDAIVEKREYHVRDLPTRTVTLFPARAQVIRDLNQLQLKPGTNEVTIIGLTPTVDESTIKVEGTGSAVISDIAIELLPNRDIFEEVYPDDESDVDNESDFYDDDDEIPDSPELESARARFLELEDEQRQANEIVDSAATRLGFLDAYGKSLEKKPSVDLVDTMSAYRTEREKVFQDRIAGTKRSREIAKLLAAAIKNRNRLEKLKRKESRPLERERKMARKKRQKEQEKSLRKRQEAWKEKERIRNERERFWPKVCYSVRVTLEAHAFTPMSSRRTSVSSDTAQVFNPSAESETETPLSCDLSLTYVTSAASWEPSYDLQLSTTNNTATLCYDASITNETSETWTNCKVILSTSQTTFSGLEEEIPELKPWKIMLAPKMGSGIGGKNILNSREERLQRETWRKAQKKTEKPVDREKLFGVERGYAFAGAAAVCEEAEESDEDMGFFLNDDSNEDESPPKGTEEILPAPHMARKTRGSMVGRLGSAVAYGVASASRRKESPGGGGGGIGEEYNYPLQDPREAALDFEESTIEETGFTTTYDLPGNKTLPPRPTASKQRVARLNFSNVAFSHTVVAKYKPAAYLKAKIRNGSRLTLLKGAAGLTLDGTFMGRTTLPRCSAGDAFTLGLGIDPAIMVTYPVADVRRATTGFFSKENSSVYTRSINIANTRAAAGKPVSLLVLDQLPVSEDERLKVDILDPKGMAIGGAGVSSGQPGRSDKEDVNWGKAVSNLKKDGQVEWEVTLNAGKAVKLGLEYVVAMPSGDAATEC
ncbi:hypothetical protein CkaCkLH20_02058 [Colletotrichum karsti]|uniref:Mucoidy inhibitor-like protein n=1 Tax=Colletotrichum karsti TaxID=1095194 RepID=A0A9P6ICS7_9PEZI|nr:uncharacterized protein CkaCkLH20_02058 [Colletotrichum karsti]KAF9880104.1 hypothetical protein CkaCkLH20_02058 [Colletotrichum karsti]